MPAAMSLINMDSICKIPEMIPIMLDYYEPGIRHCVHQARRQESPVRKLCAALFYRLLRASTSVDVPLDAGEFRLMSWRAISMF